MTTKKTKTKAAAKKFGTFRKRGLTPVPCQRCGRNLWTEESQRRGYSVRCQLLQQGEDERKKRITQLHLNLNLFSTIEMAQFEYKIIDLESIIIIKDLGAAVAVVQNIAAVLDFLRLGIVDEPSDYLLLVRDPDGQYDGLIYQGKGAWALHVLNEKDEELARKRLLAINDLGEGTKPMF